MTSLRSRRVGRDRTSGSVWYNGSKVADGSYRYEEADIADEWRKKARKAPPTQLKGMVPSGSIEYRKWRTRPPLLTTDSGFILKQNPSQGGCPVLDSGAIFYVKPGYTYRTDLDKKLILDLLAMTNPGRPVFSVPVFIRELVDIPSLFALAAKGFYSFVGGAYLNYRFGWAQFVNDIRTLVSVTTALERRIREFDSLTKHGGLRRHVKSLWSTSKNKNSYSMNNGSWGQVFYGDWTESSVTRISGSVRWVCSRDFSDDLERLGSFNLAARKIFDLEMIDASTLWQMLPWSWLVDYFVDFGTYLMASSDEYDFKPYDICIAWHVNSESQMRLRPRSGGYGTDGFSDGFIYSRLSYSKPNLPSSRVDLISMSQLKVLMALLLRFSGK